MTPALRAAMGAAAVNAARAAGYVNAGTVEFLLDDDGKFYFLEVNTRLQVEHPVTELVTGLDLVALQFRIAQGERLGLAQEDVKFAGHAIEARLCAEDPAGGFAPQVGTILVWRPACSTGVRVDHGLCDGFCVSPYYDPMLAKVVAHGSTRAEALQRLDGALRDSVVLGLRTNADLLRRIVRNAGFAAGEARTDFIEISGVLDGGVPAPGAEELLIAGVAFIEREAGRVPALLKGWRSTGPATIPLRLLWNEKAHALRISMAGNRYSLELDGAPAEIEVTAVDGRTLRFHDGARRETALVAFDGDRLHIRFRERQDLFVDATYAPPAEKAAAGDGVLKAPMVGQVVRVNAAPGTAVTKGEVLVVIEAMKMENQVIAPYDGEVESVSVSVGDHVDANQVLMKLLGKSE
jgi:geranyl-CoA carboxylase alpha subunit